MAIPGVRYGATTVDYLRDGEHLCFSCPLPDCDDSSPKCPLRRYREDKRMIKRWWKKTDPRRAKTGLDTRA
jgi:hypothetical protein